MKESVCNIMFRSVYLLCSGMFIIVHSAICAVLEKDLV